MPPPNEPSCEHCHSPADARSVQEHLEAQDKKLDRIIRFLEGDELDPDKPGLKVRMDRLEQADKQHTKIAWVFGVAIIGLAMRTLWNAVIGK